MSGISMKRIFKNLREDSVNKWIINNEIFSINVKQNEGVIKYAS